MTTINFRRFQAGAPLKRRPRWLLGRESYQQAPSVAIRRAVSNGSCFKRGVIFIGDLVFSTSGTKPAADTLDGMRPFLPPESTGEASGSRQ